MIAAKAVAFKEALEPQFKNYIDQVLKNAKALAEVLLSEGFHLVTGGTDNHLMLVDLASSEKFKDITGKVAEAALDEAGITVNKNTVPNEKRSPFVTSGIRIGTPALTTRGMKESEMKQIGKWISTVLKTPDNVDLKHQIQQQVKELCQNFPIY